MQYIAHTKDGKTYTGDSNSQPLEVHLNNVSEYSKKFAESFDAGEVGELIGLVHDIGKYQNDFQKRIRGSKIRVDHSTLGAKVLIEKWGEVGRLYGMAVASHHTGLKDSGSGANIGDDTYSARINNYKGQEVRYQEKIKLPVKIEHKKIAGKKQYRGFAYATYIKMLFSSLVDADWTDTEEYVTGVKRKSVPYSIEGLQNKLLKKIPHSDGSYINNIRAEILESCKSAAMGEQGLYTLTVPTGGGKTLSSLEFALGHALKHDLKRVIYVIPYTSIIEQNADAISNCIGKEFVLEHHSNVEIYSDENDDQDEINRLKWASENWNIPIILTTNVQFFESFFSNKPSKTRKLHNISESVIIFDEAQMLPREFLSPSMYAISELIKNYKVTAVLCSATQPAISKYKYDDIDVKEIIKNPEKLHEKLKRVQYDIAGKLDNNEIIDIMEKNSQVLCIVNSRWHAYALFKLAKESFGENVYHLSTTMCPTHRREVLKTIKAKLKNKENVVVISTSLIEAGVDIDFPIVMRSIAGLDSIIQAGGRANREGKMALGTVIVFEPTSEDGRTPRAIQNAVSISKEVIGLLKEKAFGLEGIAMYFNMLYNATNSSGVLDTKNILKEFDVSTNIIKLNFETVANEFKLIADNTKGVVVNFSNESNYLIKEIRQGIFKVSTVRKLQQYSVSIYENEYLKLKKENALEILKSGYVILNNPQYYNKETGIDIFSDNNKMAECSII
jgi:CRISPR-associated helicase Cas3/CRISPR-associated endonuclease Cas3-HD